MAVSRLISINVNSAEVAQRLNTTIDNVQQHLRREVEALSVSTHAFILQQANELNSWQRQVFLGNNGENVRWIKEAEGIWVVEIDESAKKVMDPHPRRFMEWLLSKNPKAKVSKDGRRYAVIPMMKGTVTAKGVTGARPDFKAMIERSMREQKVSLRKIAKNPDGSPKLGVVARLNIEPPGPQKQYPTLYSKPRTPEMAALSGLKPHGGIPLLQGLVITQRMEGKKVRREAVTFRVIHEGHEAEGRWYQPEWKGFPVMDRAKEYAESQLEEIVKRIDEVLKSG